MSVPGAKRGAPRLNGLITEVLSKHAWVRIEDGHGPKSGQRNRILLSKLKAEDKPAPVTTMPAGSGGDGSGGGGQAPSAAAINDADDAVDTTTASEAAWASAAEVFGSLNFAERGIPGHRR